MSPFTTLPRRLAGDAFEARVENAIMRADDLYDLDGETLLRNRDGRIATCLSECFDLEAF